ncbi:hypothetical protein R4Z09_25990 [Niallia oryzisoli]|uniref:Cytochrome b561 domain-containing protein n=1 Tax=Niallia oryzisoli TaxID=1737571 RepID=A0ABZ2CA99_9BACI
MSFDFVANNLVSADDFDDREYEHYSEHGEGHDEDEGSYEEIGKMAGWRTAILMGSAGLLLPIRRSTKVIIKTLPSAKQLIISFSKTLGKSHIMIGILVLAAILAHGILMFINEGELELEGMIGLGSIIFMAVAALLGVYLAKNKSTRKVRTIHTTLMVLACLIGVFHIFIS